jgi:phosphoadenosine phosphosulfate reductase
MSDNFQKFSEAEVEKLNARFDSAHPKEIIKWAAETFGKDAGGLVMTSSFGAESMCSIHMAISAKPDIKIVFINTGYLFPETIHFMEKMRRRHNLNVWEYHSENDPITWLTINGESDPKVRNNVAACCAANKDPVMNRAMKELAPAAWIRGVRADQTQERRKMRILQWSNRNLAWSIAPILRWTAEDIHGYMLANDLEYHPLTERGYWSIGCNPTTCTRATAEGEDPRMGRWAGTDKKECGINLDLGSGI